MKRPETGVVQFGVEDWPGVFIRGDNAFGWATQLKSVLDAIESGNDPSIFYVAGLRGFERFLRSCDVSNNPMPQYAELVDLPKLEGK